MIFVDFTQKPNNITLKYETKIHLKSSTKLSSKITHYLDYLHT